MAERLIPASSYHRLLLEMHGEDTSRTCLFSYCAFTQADFRNVFISRENEQETESFVDFDAQPTNEKTEKVENHQPDTIKAVFEDAARLSNASKDALLRVNACTQ
mmetsp:Transcript_22824/g.91384  ORF Transcript_22824/g.91384 Transcript_22824/m.91384 type:complete len:105 (-) Transcript_22824:1474-1788(-)